MSQLEQRGIAESAKKAGWVGNDTKQRYEYPVWGIDGKVIATRTKAYGSKAAMKYGWLPSKPESHDSDWYILPDAQGAIDKKDGVLYIVNGEPAVLTMQAAGIENVGSTTLSEISFPRHGVAYLLGRKISHIHYLVDNDKAGYDSAIIWRDALRGSGIDFQAFTWGKSQEKRVETDKNGHTSEFVACNDIPDKADANDIWIALNFDKAAFAHAVANLTPLALPAPIEALPKKLINLDFSEAYSKLAQDIFEAFSAQGLLTGKKFRSGFYQMRCPYHDDSNASAGIHPETGVVNCFVCGKHKVKENALTLKLDPQSYMPKPEGRKTAKKADLKAFEAALDTIEAERVLETRSYEETMLEEMNLRVMIHEHHQYVGFGQWKAFPLGILSAVMTLCTGRSHTALFLARLHDALVRGELPTVFNREMVTKATRMPYNMVSKGLFELEHLSFISKFRGIIFSIDSMQSKESMKNSVEGRPCDWYIVELEADVIRSCLHGMLEIYFLEKHSRKALAMPTALMAGQIHATNPDKAKTDTPILTDWREMVKSAMNDKANKAAKNAFDTEMHGNGKNWRGWEKALQSTAIAPLDYFACEDSLDLRAQLLNWWITKHRAENSREELCRLLGCTDPVIDKVMAKANLASDKQHCRVEFPAPKTVKQWALQWSKFQRDKQGKCWKGGFWDVTEKAWIPFDDKDYLETFAQRAGRITKGYMLIQSPSKQRPMTEDELKEREEKLAEETASQVDASRNITPKIVTEKATPSQDSDKQVYVYAKWDKHSYPFLYRQVQLFVHCFTPHTLDNHRIVNKRGFTLAQGELNELMQWALENASATPKRRVSSFYGKAYDEEKDIAALQALANERKARFDIQADVEIETDDMPIQQPLSFVPKQPRNVVQEEPEDVSRLPIFTMFA